MTEDELTTRMKTMLLVPVDEMVKCAREEWDAALAEDGRSRIMFLAFNIKAASILASYKLMQIEYAERGIELPDFLPNVTVTVKDADDVE